ncbi:MAG: orotidine-5'-phosphate decarboxylase [Alphaproteobacteria bacterium]|nr:orotidine-5'-phosphate decarboxylase [Alphaproteobacteria bacterium]
MSPIFCAIDTSDLAKARELARKLSGHVGGLKLGLEFFTAHGPKGFADLKAMNTPLFLDLKLHDIPNTVAGAVRSLLPLEPDFITIHAGGGATMIRAAMDAAHEATKHRPKILAVTVLTSLDGKDLTQVGQGSDLQEQVQRLALLAKECGADGIVCAPSEVEKLRALLGPDMTLMVPGIRPSWAEAGDQKRIMTPQMAMKAGATYLVIGRPITESGNPAQAAQRINEELSP